MHLLHSKNNLLLDYVLGALVCMSHMLKGASPGRVKPAAPLESKLATHTAQSKRSCSCKETALASKPPEACFQAFEIAMAAKILQVPLQNEKNSTSSINYGAATAERSCHGRSMLRRPLQTQTLHRRNLQSSSDQHHGNIRQDRRADPICIFTYE